MKITETQIGMNNELTYKISEFYVAIQEDNRIGPIHISLFMAVLQHWNDNNYEIPICVFGKELMKAARISSHTTYHRSIRELHKFGYITYKPSYNHFSRSLIYLPNPIAKII